MTMTREADVPIIDMAPLRGDDPDAKQEVARQIDAACRGNGFFYAANHGIDLRALQEKTTEFHRRVSEEEKWNLAINAYNPQNARIRNGFYLAVKGKKANESYCYLNPNYSEQHRLIQAKLPLHEVNVWPDPVQHQGVSDYFDGYYREVFDVSATLLRGFALALGKEEHFFDGHFTTDDTLSAVSLIRYPFLEDYPPVKTGPDGTKLSFEHHQDASLITVLYQTAVPNLQVEVDGRYQDIPVSDEYFLVNCGTFMSYITNNYYPAPMHRVKFINAERLSIPFFVNLSYASAIEPFKPKGIAVETSNPTISYGKFLQHGLHALIVANGQT